MAAAAKTKCQKREERRGVRPACTVPRTPRRRVTAGVNYGPPLRLSDLLMHRGRRTATLILLSQNVFVGSLRNIGTGSIISPAERSHSIVSLTERTASMRFFFATNYSVAKVNTETSAQVHTSANASPGSPALPPQLTLRPRKPMSALCQ